MTHTKGNGVVLVVIPVSCAGDGVKPHFVRLALRIGSFGNDADALTLDVLQLWISFGEVEGDVLDASDGTILHQRVIVLDFSQVRILWLVGVDRDVSVGLGFGGSGRHFFLCGSNFGDVWHGM